MIICGLHLDRRHSKKYRHCVYSMTKDIWCDFFFFWAGGRMPTYIIFGCYLNRKLSIWMISAYQILIKVNIGHPWLLAFLLDLAQLPAQLIRGWTFHLFGNRERDGGTKTHSQGPYQHPWKGVSAICDIIGGIIGEDQFVVVTAPPTDRRRLMPPVNQWSGERASPLRPTESHWETRAPAWCVTDRSAHLRALRTGSGDASGCFCSMSTWKHAGTSL